MTTETQEQQLAELRAKQDVARQTSARAQATADGLEARIKQIRVAMEPFGAKTPEEARKVADDLRRQAQTMIDQARKMLESAR